MLFPKKVKHRKWNKGRRRSEQQPAQRGTRLAFGSFGLKAVEGKWVTARQLEAARRVMTRTVKRGGKIWIRVFPDKPRTRKGLEVPMGGGKGSVDHYVVAVQPGRILFEMDGISEELAREALVAAGHKLPVTTVVVKRS